MSGNVPSQPGVPPAGPGDRVYFPYGCPHCHTAATLPGKWDQVGYVCPMCQRKWQVSRRVEQFAGKRRYRYYWVYRYGDGSYGTWGYEDCHTCGGTLTSFVSYFSEQTEHECLKCGHLWREG
jgi:hypothetical protein